MEHQTEEGDPLLKINHCINEKTIDDTMEIAYGPCTSTTFNGLG